MSPLSHFARRGGAAVRIRGIFRMLAILLFAGVTLARATTVVPPEFPTLVNGADYVVRAVVRDVAAEKRQGPRGPKIVTCVTFDVLEIIAGNPPGKLVLEFLGGKVGDQELRVGGMPRFAVGDEDILFVSGNGRTICPLYAMQHGRFPVVSDASLGTKYITRADGRPLRTPADSATPLADSLPAEARRVAAATALAPEEFVRQIKAARTGRALP